MSSKRGGKCENDRSEEKKNKLHNTSNTSYSDTSMDTTNNKSWFELVEEEESMVDEREESASPNDKECKVKTENSVETKVHEINILSCNNVKFAENVKIKQEKDVDDEETRLQKEMDMFEQEWVKEIKQEQCEEADASNVKLEKNDVKKEMNDDVADGKVKVESKTTKKEVDITQVKQEENCTTVCSSGTMHNVEENESKLNSKDTVKQEGNRKRSRDWNSDKIPVKVPHSSPTTKKQVWERHGGENNEIKKPSKKMEYESNADILTRRQKQIDYGKNTIGYDRYRQQVPKEMRNKKHPRTPPKHFKYSRRAWDGMIRVWRQRLHLWDPPSEGKSDINDSLSDISGADVRSQASDDTSDSEPHHRIKRNTQSSSCSFDDTTEDEYLILDDSHLDI